MAAAARQIADKWKSVRFGVGKCIIRDMIFKKSRFESTRYTMHVNMEILHPHFPKYKKERLQIPKTRFAKHISAFCEFRFLHLQHQKTSVRTYVITPFANFKNSRLQILNSGVSNSQNMRMKDHAVMEIAYWYVSVDQLLVNRIPVASSIRDPTKSDCG